MKIYLVGGAVRDKLLGLPIKERDWVVVGSTPQEMLALGYLQVGKEFPVFLHPITKEEYALARRERKIAPGYKGFSFDTLPSVSLEEDLSRRDLTINAIAYDEATQTYIDPHNGQADLKHKRLHHVSAAFSEDPVRILRVARFYARYAELGFSIHPETNALMQKMVTAGEVNALVKERVFKELDRALSENHPEQFFHALNHCGAMNILFPMIKMGGFGEQALIQATTISTQSAVRFAAFLHDLDRDKQGLLHLATLSQQYALPNYYQELTKLILLHQHKVLQKEIFTPVSMLDFFYALDVFRRERRFHDFLITLSAIAKTYDQHLPIEWIRSAAKIVKEMSLESILQQNLPGPLLSAAIKDARLLQLKNWYELNPYSDGKHSLS